MRPLRSKSGGMVEALTSSHSANCATASASRRKRRKLLEKYSAPPWASRAQAARSRRTCSRCSAAYAVSFDGFGGADTLLTQPLLMIAGSEAGSLWHSQELVAKAAGPKELYVVEGATHMTLYDDSGQVAQASKKLAAFFNQSL